MCEICNKEKVRGKSRTYFAKSPNISALERVEEDRFDKLCKASSILSFTVVGLDATMSSYSMIS